MKSITIHNIDDELDALIREKSKEEGKSLNKTIKNLLRKAGTPIPINDLWIASHCIETGSVLISYDSHFKIIPGLRLWNNG